MIELLLAREFLQADQALSWYDSPGVVSPWNVYNRMKSVAIDRDATPTSETRRQADRHFASRIATAHSYRAYKADGKRLHWQKMLHATKQALYHTGCIRYSRRLHDGDLTRAELQVIDCAVEAGLFVEHRSPPGSPKMSRLIPSEEMAEFTNVDPWTFDKNTQSQYVFLRDRDTKQELSFDNAHPVAHKYQKRLAKINEVVGLFDVFYQPYCDWSQSFGTFRQLRPVAYAVFHEDFELHGRIYTGKYGHQALRKNERRTIEFEMEPHRMEASIELDYGSYHARMAYHLAGIDYRDDPYALWGNATTPPMRLLAKTLINAAFNAKDSRSAISDCNLARYPKTKDGGWKDGNARDEAIRLDRACRETNLAFKDIHALAMQRHKPIADQFCSDAGMRFMRIDSEIALRIIYHFAKEGLPCLGVHDSFIVPQSAATELRRVMRLFYKRKTGFLPVIKRG